MKDFYEINDNKPALAENGELLADGKTGQGAGIGAGLSASRLFIIVTVVGAVVSVVLVIVLVTIFLPGKALN